MVFLAPKKSVFRRGVHTTAKTFPTPLTCPVGFFGWCPRQVAEPVPDFLLFFFFCLFFPPPPPPRYPPSSPGFQWFFFFFVFVLFLLFRANCVVVFVREKEKLGNKSFFVFFLLGDPPPLFSNPLKNPFHQMRLAPQPNEPAKKAPTQTGLFRPL